MGSTSEHNGIIYRKLIRDKIPEIIREAGKQPFTRKIQGDELKQAIAGKIIEEAYKLFKALRGGNKNEVLKESAAVCADSTGIDGNTLLDAINHREKLMSTGIGQGLAVPHVRLAGIKNASLTVAICPAGIKDYISMDGEPVNIVVLIVAPQGRHEMYIRLLASVIEVLNQPKLREKVLTAQTPQDAYKILIGAN